MVHVEFRRKFDHPITLPELKSHSNAKAPLESLQMIKQGRLSVSAVTPAEWHFILGLLKEDQDQANKDGKDERDSKDNQDDKDVSDESSKDAEAAAAEAEASDEGVENEI